MRGETGLALYGGCRRSVGQGCLEVPCRHDGSPTRVGQEKEDVCMNVTLDLCNISTF